MSAAFDPAHLIAAGRDMRAEASADPAVCAFFDQEATRVAESFADDGFDMSNPDTARAVLYGMSLASAAVQLARATGGDPMTVVGALVFGTCTAAGVLE